MAKDSLLKAKTPEPFSASTTSNWIARVGGLPPYIQHVAHDLMEKRGKSESEAIEMAIGIVKNWAEGKGNVDENTRAAARLAVEEWERKRAQAHAQGAAKKVAEAILEAADGYSMPMTFCVRCKKKVKPTDEKKCPDCGMDLSKAMSQAKKVQEAVLEGALSTKARKGLPKSAFAIPEKAPESGSYPIHDIEHARNALARCAGKPEESRVKAAVYKRYPQLKSDGKQNVKEAVVRGVLESGRDASASDEHRNVKCPECGTVQSATHEKCSNCGHDLTAARKAKFASSGAQEAAASAPLA